MTRARLGAAAFLALTVVCLVLYAVGPRERVAGGALLVGLAAFTAVVVALVLDRSPSHPVSTLLTVYLAALLIGIGPGPWLSLLAERGHIPASLVEWVADVTWALGLPLLPLMITTLPDGVPGGRWRWLWRVQITAAGCLVLAAVAGYPDTRWRSASQIVAAGAGVTLILTLPVATGRLLTRAWREVTVRRQVMPFLVVALALTASYVVLAPLLLVLPDVARVVENDLWYAAIVGGAPASIGYSVLRHRLFGVDVVVARLVVGALATGLLAVCYLGVLLVAGQILGFPRESVGLLVLPAMLAFAFLPAYRYLSLIVGRALFGRRGEPLAVLRTLREELVTIAPDDVGERFVQVVAQTLKLPWVALDLVHDDQPQTPVHTGSADPDAPVERVTVVFAGEPVGVLAVTPRRGERQLGKLDRRLLREMAAQAAPAVAASRYFSELVASRERLVTSREEERSRLRRELHDGLSPALAGISLALKAARQRVRDDPGAAEVLIEQGRLEAASSWRDVRRLLDDLGPVHLTERGLVEALVERGRSLSRPAEFEVTVHADVLPPLSGAVEIAAYRIAVEAMVNAARHATGDRCTVSLAVEAGCLRLTVEDTGTGLPNGTRPGVGMTSMRERTTELGGQLRITGGDGGTRLVARLPLGATV